MTSALIDSFKSMIIIRLMCDLTEYNKDKLTVSVWWWQLVTWQLRQGSFSSVRPGFSRHPSQGLGPDLASDSPPRSSDLSGVDSVVECSCADDPGPGALFSCLPRDGWRRRWARDPTCNQVSRHSCHDCQVGWVGRRGRSQSLWPKQCPATPDRQWHRRWRSSIDLHCSDLCPRLPNNWASLALAVWWQYCRPLPWDI